MALPTVEDGRWPIIGRSNVTTDWLRGVELLRAASRLASEQGNNEIAACMERAAGDHERTRGCPAAPAPCGYEIEAGRVILSGM
jgi:hypothetical protein